MVEASLRGCSCGEPRRRCPEKPPTSRIPEQPSSPIIPLGTTSLTVSLPSSFLGEGERTETKIKSKRVAVDISASLDPELLATAR